MGAAIIRLAYIECQAEPLGSLVPLNVAQLRQPISRREPNPGRWLRFGQ